MNGILLLQICGIKRFVMSAAPEQTTPSNKRHSWFMRNEINAVKSIGENTVMMFFLLYLYVPKGFIDAFTTLQLYLLNSIQ